SHNLEWGVVSKLLCGNKIYLKELIDLGIREIHDSRISNLKTIKKLCPEVQTVYIKPPAKRSIRSIIEYADVSLNTEYYTLKLLSDEAVRQNKLHKVIIMVETGDLREGVMGDRLVDFYSSVFELPNLEVVGLGTNLNCLHGVMPSKDKLIQLSLYKQIIELKFDKKIPYISGGTTVTIPLLKKKLLPHEINHFRVGEALYFGADLFTGKTLAGMYPNVFDLCAQIIEIAEKPMLPSGELKENPSGEMFKIDEKMYGKHSYRAIIDIGLLDVNPDFLTPLDENIKIIGA